MISAANGNGALPRAFLREFLKVGGIALFLLLAVSVTHYLLNIEADRTARETSERLNVALGKTAIADSLQNVVTDLNYLAGSGALLDFLEQDSAGTEARLSTELLHFVASKGIYDQVRLLDAQGRERVRINQNQGRPVRVPEPQLQNKADRYYFQEAWKLPPGSIYISPLDLNIEHGRIEAPPKPMIRFGVSISRRSGEKTGILLLNYLGQTLIDDFHRAVSNIADQAMLLNSDGFWLSSPRAEDEWGFMFDNGRSFDNSYPAEWERISRDESGQLQTANGFFSFITVYPVFAALGGWEPGVPGAPSERSWKIVSHVEPLALNSASAKFLRRNLPLYLSILALLLAGAALLAAANVRHRQVAGAMEFERRFRSIMENMHLLSVGLDAEGKVNFCNHTMLDLCGRRREELLGLDWFDLCTPEAERPAARAHFQQLLQASRPLPDHEEHIRNRVGEERLIGWHDTLMRDADGKVVGITRIGDDITEARRSEDDIRKLSSAVVHSPATVMIVDSSGSIEYVNPKFTQLTGYTLEDVKGKQPSILKSGKTSREEYADLWNTVSSGREWRGVFQNRKKNGELYWEAASISAVRDKEGIITHYIAVKEDITEKMRLERTLLHNQALAAVGRMASMVAHDLRNPLSSIKMALQMLQKDLAGGARHKQQELLGIALEQVYYTENLMTDLLSYSRPDALKPEWLEVDKLLEKTLILAQKNLDRHQVRLATNYQTGLPTLHGDTYKLQQVFSNLIVNAAQAAADGDAAVPRVTVAVYQELGGDRPSVRIEICDNGFGVDSEQAERLFEPFFTTRPRGTGLGLAIVRRIVDQHQGQVRLDAQPAGGACAVVILPVGPVVERDASEPAVDADKPNLALGAST